MPPTILIVDDERELVESYVRLLGRGEFRCVPAFDGDEAIRIFDSELPDLVLTDLNLPATSGYELICHIRECSPATPVIVMSGYGSPEAFLAARRAGAMVCLNKPVPINVLMAQILIALAPRV
jgi:DNA-binding response OmpR family regulator